MGQGNVASRISAVERDERGQMIRYEALLNLAEKERGSALDLNCHRYKAVAYGMCVGHFSSLTLAFAEVDHERPLWGSTWEQSEPQADLVNYVQDVIGNRTFVRVVIQKQKQAGV